MKKRAQERVTTTANMEWTRMALSLTTIWVWKVIYKSNSWTYSKQNCYSFIGKISAQTLDVLSKGFEDELLPILLPTLKETLYHPEWRIMESGILALASIAEGCKKGMADHLAELFPLLISCLLEKRAIVRTITRWTLCGCYAPLMLGQPHDQYIKPLITELLKRIGTEGNERVQAAACIALETLQVIQLNPTIFYSPLGISFLFLILGRGRHTTWPLLLERNFEDACPCQRQVSSSRYWNYGRLSR